MRRSNGSKPIWKRWQKHAAQKVRKVAEAKAREEAEKQKIVEKKKKKKK